MGIEKTTDQAIESRTEPQKPTLALTRCTSLIPPESSIDGDSIGLSRSCDKAYFLLAETCFLVRARLQFDSVRNHICAWLQSRVSVSKQDQLSEDGVIAM